MVFAIKIWYGAMNWVKEDDENSVGQIDVKCIFVQTREAEKWHKSQTSPF